MPNAAMPATQTRPPAARMMIANPIAGTAATRRAPRSEPVLRRRARWARRWEGGCGISGSPKPLAPPEPAAAGRVRLQAVLELLAREVRPQRVAEDELGIGGLP